MPEYNDSIHPLSECLIEDWRRAILISLSDRPMTEYEIAGTVHVGAENLSVFLTHLVQHNLVVLRSDEYALTDLVEVERSGSRVRLRVSNAQDELAEVRFRV